VWDCILLRCFYCRCAAQEQTGGEGQERRMRRSFRNADRFRRNISTRSGTERNATQRAALERVPV